MSFKNFEKQVKLMIIVSILTTVVLISGLIFLFQKFF